MLPMGLDMLKTKRLDPMCLISNAGIKDTKGLHAMLKKAREIEDKRKGLAS